MTLKSVSDTTSKEGRTAADLHRDKVLNKLLSRICGVAWDIPCEEDLPSVMETPEVGSVVSNWQTIVGRTHMPFEHYGGMLWRVIYSRLLFVVESLGD